jgi:hypothetical protein
MSLTMHAASVPVIQRMFASLLSWLDKAEAHAATRGFDPANYLGLRLAPDMLPLIKQVQIASDTAKGCVARLAGIEVPKWADDEASIADLRARVQRTIDFAGSVPAQAFEEAAGRSIVLPMRNRDPLTFTGSDYLRFFALPNFYFHVTTTYALLRHAGVPLGKTDYLGG